MVNICLNSLKADASMDQVKDHAPRTPSAAVVGNLYRPTTVYVITEGQILHSFNNLVDAIFHATSAFYVFNIEFPKQACNTWTFVESVLLELHTKIPKKVLTLRGKLQVR